MGKYPNLDKKWMALFQEPATLEEYAKKKPVSIKNATIEGFNISDINLPVSRFTGTKWQGVVARHMTFGDLEISDSIIVDTNFAKSTILKAEFTNVEFNNVTFVGATLGDIKFVNCRFKNTRIRNLKKSNIEISESEGYNVEFFESILAIKIYKSTFDEINLAGLKIGSSIELDNSQFNSIEVYDSELSNFVISNCRIRQGDSKNTTINKVYIENSDLAISFDESIIQQLTVSNSTGKCGVSDAKIDKFTMNKHNGELPAWGLLFTEAVISNSQLSEFTLTKSKGDSLTLNSLKSEDTDFENMLVKEFNLNEVEFTVKLDMTNTMAEETIANAVILRPGLELLNEGSNIQLR